MVDIYECKLVAHDYLFFTTKGFKDTSMTNFLGNYALMYAVNRTVARLHRNVAGSIPFYEEDRKRFPIYCTPAVPSNSLIQLCGTDLSWPWHEQVFITFNSINTILNTTIEVHTNLPQLGRKGRLPPLNSFRFFAIGGDPAGLVRIGKKFVQARIHSVKLGLEREVTKPESFAPSHPVNPADLESIELEEGVLVRQFPPLIAEARIRAPHYICRSPSQTFKIAKPDVIKYASVRL